ncbi:hypothetical protein M8C21_024718, partial [Ambrosia artemisiifolia]
ILVLAAILLVHATCAKAIRCPNCGTTSVPYPLTTEPACGQQLYKVRCDSGVLKFDTLNNTYLIKSIIPKNQTLVIQQPHLLPNTCDTVDHTTHSIQLNTSLSFTISHINCTDLSIELKWVLPPEPPCKTDACCDSTSTCKAASDGALRCFCKHRFHWDAIAGQCASDFTRIKPKKIILLVPTMCSGVILILSVLFATTMLIRHHRIKAEQKLLTIEREKVVASGDGGKSAKIFTIKEIKRATKNFSSSGLLGVRILGQVNHKNLVHLIGCCIEQQPLLVYEFIPNGSLFYHLHDKKEQSLTWGQRLGIAHDTAQGLAYLHFSTSRPIYHRDVKSSNILLDHNMKAKVADFGLSRLAHTDVTHVTTCAQGTLGYLDPDYYWNYQLTDKSDVYSFGVLLLEILTCQKAIDFGRPTDDVNLVAYVKRMANEERLVEVIDPLLKEHATSLDIDAMKAFGFLAMSCLEERRENRPTMKEVSEEIEYIMGVKSSTLSADKFTINFNRKMAAKPVFSIMLTVALMLTYATSTYAATRCPDCGSTQVPYPLSTGPGCGDPSYKIRCNTSSNTLFFDTPNNTYPISSISQPTQRFIIQPSRFLNNNNTCVTADVSSQGLQLDPSLPFNITSGNTIMYLNCSRSLLRSPLNCTSTSLCHSYINNSAEAASCGRAPICCTFRSGGSSTMYSIRVREGGCQAYRSFVNLDYSLPVNRWPDSGVEIQWVSPPEPLCGAQTDCDDRSRCVRSGTGGVSRCLCNAGFHWDGVDGVCALDDTCENRGDCSDSKRTALIAGLTSGLGSALVAVIIGLLLYKRHLRHKEALARLAREREEILNAGSGKSAKVFTGKEIKKATANFSKDRLLGSGGYGEVYKGILEDSTVVAVKCAKVGNTKGTDQVLNEVRILCQVNHRGLVRLLGCCVELEQPLLVYEYIPNGTLLDHLKGRYNGIPPDDVNLAIYVKRVVEEERLLDAVDPNLKKGASKLELETMKALGFLAVGCLEERRQNRPSMKEVTEEIEYILSIATS